MSWMSRNCFEPGGMVHTFLDGQCRQLAPNVAGRITCGRSDREWRDVTWDEILDQRRAKQAERLERIRQPDEPEILPCYIWTFLNTGFPYSGWYCYAVTRHFEHAINFKGFDSTLAESIMTAIPLGFLPMLSNFDSWMIAFTKKYPCRRHQDPRKAGVHFGWLKDRHTFSIHRQSS